MNAAVAHSPLTLVRNPDAMGPSSTRVTRTYAASPDKVFRAWTDPDSIKAWFAKGEECSADVREGGLFYIAMRGMNKLNHHYGRYLRIDKPRTLEFTWVSEWTLGKESVVTIEIAAHGTQTELTLTHEGLPSEEHAAMHNKGWSGFLDELTERLP